MPYNPSYEMWRSWGEAMRRRRHSKGMTQKQLSEKTGIPIQTIGLHEYKHYALNILFCYAVAEALDWTIDDWRKEALKIMKDGTWDRKLHLRCRK